MRNLAVVDESFSPDGLENRRGAKFFGSLSGVIERESEQNSVVVRPSLEVSILATSEVAQPVTSDSRITQGSSLTEPLKKEREVTRQQLSVSR